MVPVELNRGENEWIATSEDAAGNSVTRSFTFTYGERLPPRFDLQLIDRGPGLTPLVSGSLHSEDDVIRAEVGIDPTFNGRVIDLVPLLRGEQFSLDPFTVESVLGSPPSSGPVTLNFRAFDQAGRQSSIATLEWQVEPEAAWLTSRVVRSAGSYEYILTAGTPPDSREQLEAIRLPVADGVTIGDLMLPPGWSAETLQEDASAVLQFDFSGEGQQPAGEPTFRFVSDSGPVWSIASLALNDRANGQPPRSVGSELLLPGSPTRLAHDDRYHSGEDETLTVTASEGLFANDADAIRLNAFDQRTRWGAGVEVFADGGFTVQPGSAYASVAADETVRDAFVYSVVDANGNTHDATVVIEVRGENDPPIAVDDLADQTGSSLRVRGGAASVIDTVQWLANDLDPDAGDILSVASVSATSQLGAAVERVDGRIVYDPRAVAVLNQLPAGQSRIDRITYTVTDGRSAPGPDASATAEIIVYSGNNLAPTASDHAVTIAEDGERVAPTTFTLLDQAVDADAIAADPPLAVVEETVSSELGATVTLFADGSFQYQAADGSAIDALNEGEQLADSFAYRVSDGFDASAAATVHLTVLGRNDPPLAVDDVYDGVAADGVLTVESGGLLANDRDVDNAAALLIDPSRTAETSAAGGIVSLSPDGTFTYDPAAAFDGLAAGEIASDSFTYVVVDPFGGEATATVTLQIVGVDDVAVAGDDGIERGFWTVASRAIEVPASAGLLVNDQDPDVTDDDVLAIADFEATSRYGARVNVNPDGSFSYDPTDSQTLADFQAAGIDVVDRFSYRLFDSGSRPVAASMTAASPQQSPGRAGSEGVVEIIVRSAPSSYRFDLVASGYERIGPGVSINNHGHVAFSATRDGKDNLFIWEEDGGVTPLIPDELMFGDALINVPGRGDPTAAPMMRFSVSSRSVYL